MPRRWYLSQVPQLERAYRDALEADELRAQRIDMKTSKDLQKRLREICEEIRERRQAWEREHGTVPDEPPFGLL